MLMDCFLFFISLLFTTLTSTAIGRRLASDALERFWIFWACMAAQLGTIATVLSLLTALTASGWILAGLMIYGITIALSRNTGLPFAPDIPTLRKTMTGTFRRCLPELPVWATATLIASGLLIISSGIAQLFTPIWLGDEKMYHASRVIYWMQHRSIFPYVSHNDRQTVFTFGSELFFLWPVLLTKSETLGRMVFWLGYPAAAVGQYVTLRAMNAGRDVAVIGVLVFISTPIITQYSVGLKPEMWSVLFLLGIAFWLVRTCLQPFRVRHYFFLGLFI
jgi:hypothetical protein